MGEPLNVVPACVRLRPECALPVSEEADSTAEQRSTKPLIVPIYNLLAGLGHDRVLPVSVMCLGGFFTFTGMVLTRCRGRLVGGLRRYRLRVDMADEQHASFLQTGSDPLEWEVEVP